MVTIKNIAEMFDKDVFTNKGYYLGKVKDLEFDLSRYRLRSVVVETSRDSELAKLIGGKRGVIIPYPVVQAVGDIVIIKHIVASKPEEGEISTEEVEKV